MNRKSLVASSVLVVGLAAALLSAQTTSSNGKWDQKTIQTIRVKVIGCVAAGSEAGHYRLTNAFLSGDNIPSTAGTVGTTGSGQDLSFEGHRAALRALTSAPRPAQSRPAGPALSADPAVATPGQQWVGRNILLSTCAIFRVDHRRIAPEALRSHVRA